MEGRDDKPTSVQLLSGENVQPCDKNKRFFSKVGHLASGNKDLSCRLIQSEEERLKITKELVEEKIQTDKIREQYEDKMFELKNKILQQEGLITLLQTERDNLSRELQSTEDRLKMKEKCNQDLTEEYAILKRDLLALTEAYNKGLAQSHEPSAELLEMARVQDDLRRQLEEQQQSVKASAQGLHGELDRMQALINCMSQNGLKPEDLAALDKEQKSMKKALLVNQDEIKDTLKKMKNSYVEQQKNLEEKVVVVMTKEHQENNISVHVSLKKLSEESVMCCQSEMKKVEEENSKLQLRIKEMNDEYRTRLLGYLEDIADYIDGPGKSKGPSEQGKIRVFVDGMLQDIRSSYRVREEQLTSAARSYKKRLQRITNIYHTLLTAYRGQREQILAKPESGLEAGPPEVCFSLESSELR